MCWVNDMANKTYICSLTQKVLSENQWQLHWLSVEKEFTHFQQVMQLYRRVRKKNRCIGTVIARISLALPGQAFLLYVKDGCSRFDDSHDTHVELDVYKFYGSISNLPMNKKNVSQYISIKSLIMIFILDNTFGATYLMIRINFGTHKMCFKHVFISVDQTVIKTLNCTLLLSVSKLINKIFFYFTNLCPI